MGSLFRCYLGYGGHITKPPVMLSYAIADRHMECKVRMVGGTIDVIDKRRSLFSTAGIVPMA